MSEIGGWVRPGFDRVMETFSRVMAESSEKGAAVALVHEGEVVVNLWAGGIDRHATRPWQQDTLACVFSTSKAVTALCVQRAIDLKLIDPTRDIRACWPAFDRPDKRSITLASVLNHRSGLPAFSDPIPDPALFDWDYMTSALVRQTPWWTPGSRHGYHMVTWGWLVGEVFRRTVGVTVGQFLREEISGPLGIDVHIGLDDDAIARTADMQGPRTVPGPDRLYLFGRAQSEPEGITAKAMMNPASLMGSSNLEAWRRMELPSANGHASALGLATLFDHAACSERVVSARARARLQMTESQGPDLVMHTDTRFGPGVMLQMPGHPECGFGPGEQAFGHAGSGGSLAFADPVARIGFAYVMNQMNAFVFVDPRARQLLDAAYACLKPGT